MFSARSLKQMLTTQFEQLVGAIVTVTLAITSQRLGYAGATSETHKLCPVAAGTVHLSTETRAINYFRSI